MSRQEPRNQRPSAAARAEAAAWVARLHGPNRTKEVDAGLRRWLADDPEHPRALELLTDTWEISRRLRRRPMEQVMSWELVGFRLSVSRALLATVATAIVAVIGTIYFLHTDVISTGIGELRTLTLQDGTRIQMNSSTRLAVHYDKSLRQVSLESGEAYFEVAKDPHWPFMVSVDGNRIRDIGTQFDVRRQGKVLTVTLVEGKVTVTPPSKDAWPASPLKEASQHVRGNDLAVVFPNADDKTFTLTPGERLTLAPTRIPKIDRPPLDLVTAWAQGQVVLDNTSLAEAAAEMNRYSRQKILLEDPATSAIRVSGIFKAGDSTDFAAAVAKSYRLTVRAGSDTITLAPEAARHAPR